MAKRGYESQKTGQKVDDLLDKIDNLNVPEWALQESKPSYTAQEVHALPENTSIPRKTSDLVNDKGFITQESDPTVPSWAKQPSKPGYTAQEVGALPSDTPLFSGDYNDLRNKPTIPTVPENVSAFNNDAGYLTNEDMGDYATKQELQGKQDTINDLSAIRSGASAGATAYQKPQAGIPESDLSQGVKDKMNEKEVFWATYGTTTAAEIDAAIAAGKEVLCLKDDRVYQLVINASNLTYIQFFAMLDTSVTYLRLKRSNNAWDSTTNSFQKTSDRVTAFQSTPDNTHYPSEKLVKDSLDAKAGIGDVLFANFSNLTPKKTFEYDVSDKAYHPLFSRANTGISQLMSEVDDIVKFRITVTGTNIYARVDVVVRFQPALTAPCVMAWNDTFSTSTTTTGIYILRSVFPKALNSGYDFAVEFNCYNNTTRHIKVEVFEDTDNIVWIETNESTLFNSTYHGNMGLSVYIYRGLCASQTWRLESGTCYSATSTSFINSYLTTWLGGTLPLAGEALAANQLAIISGQKAYKVTNKNVPIDCDCGVFLNSYSFAAGTNIAYTYVRQKFSWGSLTGDPALTMDTFARGDQVYLRCTLGQDGKIYPDGHLSNVKSAGYTWVHIGTAASATAINLDTCGKPFITLNNDGKVTHINGTAVMDSSMSKWGVVSQTQTWTQASDGGYDYTMSDLQYGWIPQANIDLYEAAGAVFNEQSGYFELNGLVDISYEEMGEIYEAPRTNQFPNGLTRLYQTSYIRTNIPTITNSAAGSMSNGSAISTCNGSGLETLVITRYTNGGIGEVSITTMNYFAASCMHLKKILSKIYLNSNKNNQDFSNSFMSCWSLEEVHLFRIGKDISFIRASRLKTECIAEMINNCLNETFTITLHPTAYARAIADSDVQAALQAHTNVSLASA